LFFEKKKPQITKKKNKQNEDKQTHFFSYSS